MPHVIVKMFAGKDEGQKIALTDAIAKALTDTIGSREAAISVSIGEFTPEEWTEKVYQPEIANGAGKLYRKPGY